MIYHHYHKDYDDCDDYDCDKMMIVITRCLVGFGSRVLVLLVRFLKKDFCLAFLYGIRIMVITCDNWIYLVRIDLLSCFLVGCSHGLGMMAF